MSALGDKPELRVSFMLKRSLGKSTFTIANYKYRFFVLYPNCLKYYNGTIEKGRGKEKGCIPLSAVKTVATVLDGELDNRDNAFQVVYEENGEHLTLYVVAENDGMKKGWIKSIRDECQKVGVKLVGRYHPGVWSKKRSSFSCCNQLLKTVGGCEEDSELPKALRELTITRPIIDTVDSPSQAEKRVAMFDYNAADPSDLALVKGEEYLILDSSKENWWLAKNKKGQTGNVPANYLRDVNSLEAYTWYFKNISRARVDALLSAEGRDGTYLVRDSVQKPGCYTLSVYSKEGNLRAEGLVKHYHINKKTDPPGFFISQNHVFPSIPEVINYHKMNGAGLVTRLKCIPNDSSSQPATAGLGCGIWEIKVSELRVLEELGRGQFGCVRKGIWRGTTEVAIKMMNPQSMSEDDFIEEAKTMTELQHPNLVQLYGVCIQKPIFIIVEYLANGSLQVYLKRKRFELLGKVQLLMDICIQVCYAMTYLESKNIIHRDLAARNCLVGKNNTVKVCDFGLARFVADDEYTSSSGTKFPVRWAPPEVLNFSRFSSKSDVWAFGVLMWEVFACGATPYGKLRNHDVAEIVNQGRTLDKPERCPSPVFRVMRVCWTPKPESRPGFSRVMTDLESIIERDYQE